MLRDYSPPTGLLADLVSEGFIKDIPNDPWTSRSAVSTGAEEDVDWYYANDGETLTLYAYSHPHRKYILPSFGKAPLGDPLVTSAETPAPSKPAKAAEPQKVKKNPEPQKVKKEPEHQKTKKEPEPQKVKKDPEHQKTKKEPEPQKVKKDPEHQKTKKEPEPQKTKKESKH